MNDLIYILNPKSKVDIKGKVVLSNEEILKSIQEANRALKSLNEHTKQFDINIFEALGMRNQSGLVGEYFARSVMRVSNGKLNSNLHQDGYPDLLLTDTKDKLDYFQSLYIEKNGKKYPVDKEAFSPFKYGGIEIKATCGSTPPANQISKPLIGEQRIKLITGFDWKAHHRNTNNLLAVLWDFIDENPTIVACFYRNDLTTEDWGKIVQPKEEGGRTTSVSIMKQSAVKKMCANWIVVIDDRNYIGKLSEKKWIGYNIRP